MKKIIISWLIICSGVIAQDMQRNANRSLFSDFKAIRIGDAITVVVIESSKASNSAETSAGRESEIGFGAAGTFGDKTLPGGDLGVSSNNDFKGSGSTQTSGMVSTKISALIDSIYANGNLRIVGKRKIVINGEEQIIRIKGIVRPSDVLSDNSVLSYNISEAEIIFEGSGMIERSQEPGWFTKLFHWLF
ncbi:MAG: flagellar basal body L-ring protein FlgH [Melioribacteraceae bacterium]|nr:flagellar basal body L-ring protein FlgH [Melioribacteraceae bacterium]MCF8355157.1 flagellar basal body L-ring protein FlgH [Melioribacteraceae bacterium]MCF8392486.1 flagellar basal body L-ring protein FlgH [Melioribacteraceae bacterium]MCF8418397.1 flagellar basal body L-ring protein FlgH [Melioribacteraceae bacterium]